MNANIGRSFSWKRVPSDRFGRRWEVWEWHRTTTGWDEGRPIVFNGMRGRTFTLRYWRETSAARVANTIFAAYNEGARDQRARASVTSGDRSDG